MTPERLHILKSFEQRSGVRFRDLSLLNLALTHRSFANEAQDSRANNERLEFLGDSILGMVVSAYLYSTFPERPEGDLAKIKSFVVSEEILSVIARDLGMDEALLVGKGEEHSGGRLKKAILADALEAIFGACYLDAGYVEAERLVLSLLVAQVSLVIEDKHRKDYKTLLQELVQKELKSYPRYVVSDRTGPDHDRTFTVEVWIEGQCRGTGAGKNKKEAEQAAAGEAYLELSGQSAAKVTRSH